MWRVAAVRSAKVIADALDMIKLDLDVHVLPVMKTNIWVIVVCKKELPTFVIWHEITTAEEVINELEIG